jgi:hypothetical protein
MLEAQKLGYHTKALIQARPCFQWRTVLIPITDTSLLLPSANNCHFTNLAVFTYSNRGNTPH